MKIKYAIITTLSIAAFSTGCNPGNNQPEVTNAPPTQTQAEQLRQDSAQTSQDWKSYTYAEKDKFISKMKAELADLNQQMDDLGRKIQNSTATARDEAQAKLNSLRDRSSTLYQDLEKVKNSSASTWDEVKSSTVNGYEQMKVSFNNARQWLSEKIAPSSTNATN